MRIMFDPSEGVETAADPELAAATSNDVGSFEGREVPDATPEKTMDQFVKETQAKLSKVHNGEPVEDAADEAVQDEAPDEVEETQDEAVEGDEAEAAAEGDEAQPEAKVEKKTVAPAKPEANVPTLSDQMERSLIAYGFTKEQITQNAKAMGAGFLQFAAQVHANRRSEIAQWSQAGRVAKQNGLAGEQGGNQQQAPKQDAKPIVSFDQKAVVDGLQKKYGNDPMVADIVEAMSAPMNAALAAINAVLPDLQAGQKEVKSQGEQALLKEINGFFTGDTLKPYAALYGDGKKGLTPEQREVRNRLLEEADALSLGAKMQGRSLTTAEALTAAHDIVSSDFKVTAARQSVRKESKQRERGIQQRPSNRAKPSTGNLTMDQFEKRTAERLAALGR